MTSGPRGRPGCSLVAVEVHGLPNQPAPAVVLCSGLPTPDVDTILVSCLKILKIINTHKLICMKRHISMRRACQIALIDADRSILERWSRGRSTQARLGTRARVVLAAAEGKENKDIAVDLNISRGAVGRWRERFATAGVAGLEKDAPRGGRPPKARQDLVRRIIELTTQQMPANATHWSTRTLAEALGTNRSLVNRVWRAHGLKPHLCRNFKFSNDPRFAEKLLDVLGSYLDPPEHALVLCVDKKSQMQALDRTQKSLPIYPGRGETMTHEYKRNGTTTLFRSVGHAGKASDRAMHAAASPSRVHQIPQADRRRDVVRSGSAPERQQLLDP